MLNKRFTSSLNTKANSLIHKQSKSKKGITPILATLLLIVIAVAAIVVTYAWIMTYMSNAGRQAGVRLYKANVSWDQNTHSKIYIDIGNSGTSDTQIILVYVGTSPSNLQNQTSPSFPLACNAGATPARITVDYNNWTPGATYYFKVLSSSGQYIDTWAEQAPVS
jgi:flagellin-like protein